MADGAWGFHFQHSCPRKFCWANMVICFYRFINICRHASTNTQTFLPPPANFLSINKISKPILFPLSPFLPSFPSLPPSLPSFPFSRSNQVPQLEVKSLAIPPPCFWPRLPPSFPLSLQAFCNTFLSILSALFSFSFFHFICLLLPQTFACDTFICLWVCHTAIIRITSLWLMFNVQALDAGTYHSVMKFPVSAADDCLNSQLLPRHANQIFYETVLYFHSWQECKRNCPYRICLNKKQAHVYIFFVCE